MKFDDNDIIYKKEAEAAGISRYEFYKFVKDKSFEKIAPGIYAPEDKWVDDLLIIHQRCPKAVFSHDEAFFYHGLTDREPLQHTLTIYSGYNSHRLKEKGHKVYTVKKELLELGKTSIVNNMGNTIPMYDLERTICDLFRNRNTIEKQEFNSVLKTYVNRKDKNLNKLMDYAEQFRLSNVIRRYMEVLL